MELVNHLIYEYKKGVRDLILHTCEIIDIENIEKTLKLHQIEYLICSLEHEKINVFFGNSDCIEIVKHFSTPKLQNLSAQEDFMLGIMLGYSKKEQYKRFLKKSFNKEFAII